MNSDTLTIADPQLAWALLPGVLLSVWAVLQLANWRKRLAKLGESPVALRLVASFDLKRAMLRTALWILALVLLVGAAVRPRYGMRETEVSNAGIDIALVIDASKSMLVKDVVPSRLQGTALEISALLSRLAGGRVALVPFAGIPFVQCPLTSDHDVIRTYLQDLRPEDLPVGGTNIGRALTLATELLSGEKENAEAELRDNLMPQFKGSKNKAIVLFSDGEDHEGAALAAARKAAEVGIRVYTVGVGSSFGDPVPVLGPDGTATGVLKDEAGNPVFSKLNMDLLDEVAKASGGQAFRYSNQSVAPQLFAALDSLEKAEFQAQFKQLGEDRYQLLLGPAILLLLAELLLAGRRGQPFRRRKPAAALASLLMIGMAVPAHATWLEHENGDIAKGRNQLTDKKYGEALQSFKQAQASRPEHALIWYDIGLAHGWMGSHADAVTALARALGAMQDRDAKFEADIHYAIGTTQLQWGELLQSKRAAAPPPPKPDDKAPPEGPTPPAAAPAADEDPLPHLKLAVQHLEQALLADPTRVDVRRNLELARLAAYPPCSQRDKTHEPNDTPDAAKALTLPDGERETAVELRICPNESDYFAIAAEPGDRISAKVALKPEPASATEDATAPTGKPGVTVALLAADGKTFLDGAPDGPATKESAEYAAITSPQQVLVGISDRGEIESPYTLTIKVLPACGRLEERAEPNDTPLQAKPATAGQAVTGRMCPANPDYLKVALMPGQGLRASAKAKVDHGADQFNLDIVSSTDVLLSHGAKGKEATVARLATQQGGDVFVRLVGSQDTEADYQVMLEVLPPCSERDDNFEDNDQAAQANPLDREMTQKPLDSLQLCPGDDDWYAVQLQAGESLFVDLGASVENTPDAAELAGALTVEVWDDKGQLWGRGEGGPVTGTGSVVRTVAVLAPPPGHYRVRVTGGGVEVPKFPPEGLPTLPLIPEPPAQQQPQQPQPAQGQPAQGQPSQGQPSQGQPPTQHQPAQPGVPSAPVPKPIPHVQLPEGTPAPAVDPRNARLDLQYTLQLKILPPCPAGNDELEPNDAAKDAKPLEVGGERLLRICPGDTDWLQVTQKAGQNLQFTARYDGSHGPLDLVVIDESGVKELARAQTASGDDGKMKAPTDDSPQARARRTAIAGATLPAAKADRVVKLRVSMAPGAENFYVLRVEEPPPPSDKQDQQQQEQDKKDQQDKQEEKDKQDQQKQDEKKSEPDQPKPTPEQKAEQERQRRQMERNDHNPNNLEAEEALRKSPFKNSKPDKDW